MLNIRVVNKPIFNAIKAAGKNWNSGGDRQISQDKTGDTVILFAAGEV